MNITSTYLGTEIGSYSYLFFLLTEDYIRAQKRINDDLDRLLHVFARNLGGHVAIVQPFPGDEAATINDVMHKKWTPDQIEILERTPGFLIISVGFTEFQPNKDKWVYISLREVMNDNGIDIFKVSKALRMIVEACRGGEDIFTTVHNYYAAEARKQLAASIQLKPGWLGFGVDLKGMVRALRHRAT